MAAFGDETFSQKIDEILRLSEENNRMLRAMRRGKWLGAAMKVVVWVVILGVSYYFLMQMLSPILDSVQQIQSFTGTGAKTATSTNNFQQAIDLYNQYKNNF